MKLVAISQDLLEAYRVDSEVLHKSKRPYVLVVQLKYRGEKVSFAIPIRSNIPAASPKNEYFPLPPRKTTKNNNRHGLHYIKMFPVNKSYYYKYRIDNNAFAIMIDRIIRTNFKQIVQESQAYLTRYELGDKSVYSTNIDLLCSILNNKKCIK